MSAVVVVYCDREVEHGTCVMWSRQADATDVAAARQAAATEGWTHDETKGDTCPHCGRVQPRLRVELPEPGDTDNRHP